MSPEAHSKPDLVVLISAVAIVVGLLFFFLIAAMVQAGGIQELDEGILKAVREWSLRDASTGEVWGEDAAIAITSLGSVIVLAGLIFTVLGLLFLTRKREAGVLLIAALLGALALNWGLKSFFGRARPEVVPRLQRVDTKSFPSGHALIATAVYATLGAVAARLLRERRLKLFIVSIALILSVAIGLSRVYLGVHYASDVLAGWTIGLLWALICWLVARALQRRGALERPR